MQTNVYANQYIKITHIIINENTDWNKIQMSKEKPHIKGSREVWKQTKLNKHLRPTLVSLKKEKEKYVEIW
jgi:hypothetical protein